MFSLQYAGRCKYYFAIFGNLISPTLKWKHRFHDRFSKILWSSTIWQDFTKWKFLAEYNDGPSNIYRIFLKSAFSLLITISATFYSDRDIKLPILSFALFVKKKFCTLLASYIAGNICLSKKKLCAVSFFLNVRGIMSKRTLKQSRFEKKKKSFVKLTICFFWRNNHIQSKVNTFSESTSNKGNVRRVTRNFLG